MLKCLLKSIIPTTSLTAISSIALAGEVVQLRNGNTLSGNILASDTKSVVHLNQPFTKSPIKIKEEAIRNIFFENSNTTSEHKEQIHLINGDHFPCDITSITDNNVSFKSNVTGALVVDRDMVSRINFNTEVSKPIYIGPGDDLSAWSTTSEDWDLKDGVLSVSKRSEASQTIKDLPENFILKFSTRKNQLAPHFSLCFGCSNPKADRKSDHYYIDFNSHGVALYRSKNAKTNSLANILSNDQLFNAPQINVTVHVDRKHQKLAFFINNKLIKTISEAIPAPKGNILVIKNLQREGTSTTISDINIHSWNGKVNELSEEAHKSLSKHDLITDSSGNIITANIINFADKKNSALIFKAPFTKENSDIPIASLQTLEFKHSAKVHDLEMSNFSIKLTNGATISYSISQFLDSKMQLDHPILGSISIPKFSLSSIIATPKKAPVDKVKEAQ